jgi:hypothetical protein
MQGSSPVKLFFQIDIVAVLDTVRNSKGKIPLDMIQIFFILLMSSDIFPDTTQLRRLCSLICPTILIVRKLINC